MSRIIFDFLLDSFLFNPESVSNNFSGFTDDNLKEELSRYRQHILSNLETINKEITQEASSLGAYFDTSSFIKPSIETLKQTALYYDRTTLDDPLFTFTQPESDTSNSMAKFAGFSPDSSIDRGKLSKAINFMIETQPMVGIDFLKYAPISLIHEPPQDIPLTYSETLYAERVPGELIGWFHKKVKVLPLRQKDNGMLFTTPGDTLEPCRRIVVQFSNHSPHMIYHLTAMKATPHPDKPDILKTVQWIPEEAPDQQHFDVWVTQSINQTAGSIFNRIVSDMSFARDTGSMLITNSEFISELLSRHLCEERNIDEDLSRLSFSLDLPFIESISVEDLMRLKQNEGEAFYSFRLNLQRHLRDLRHEKDSGKLAKRMEDVRHELCEVQVREVENKIRKIKKELFGSFIVGTASLATVIPTTGLSLASFILAGYSAYKKGVEYYHDTKEHPAYFLWRIKKKAS